jgi:hypothetical protein
MQQPQFGGPGRPVRFRVPPSLRRLDEDEMLMTLLLAAMPGLLRRH